MRIIAFVGSICVFSAASFGQTVFTVDMDGAQADGGNGTGSLFTGSGTVTLNPAETMITVALTHDIPAVDATVGHIHVGAVGVEGAIVFGFSSGDSPVNEVFAISPAEVTTLKANGFYVNIHTTAFINGEIRGQILAPPAPFVPVPASNWLTLSVLAGILLVLSGFYVYRRAHQ
ncbi:MAG: CHRD domain-containing protein [Candidatus Hydrogenedentales bacterium]